MVGGTVRSEDVSFNKPPFAAKPQPTDATAVTQDAESRPHGQDAITSDVTIQSITVPKTMAAANESPPVGDLNSSSPSTPPMLSQETRFLSHANSTDTDTSAENAERIARAISGSGAGCVSYTHAVEYAHEDLCAMFSKAAVNCQQTSDDRARDAGDKIGNKGSYIMSGNNPGASGSSPYELPAVGTTMGIGTAHRNAHTPPRSSSSGTASALDEPRNVDTDNDTSAAQHSSNLRSPIGAFFIGVSGASASGKTTVCTKIMDGLADQRCALISLDWFYRGLPEGIDPGEYNFDHPDAFDFEALGETLRAMRKRQPVEVPMYDFALHRRDPANATKIGASDVVIIEGILTFYDRAIRSMLNMKIFVDEDADICLARRIQRDVKSRGRSVESILSQYQRFVKPSFEEYILPTKRYCDIVVPRGGENIVAIDLIIKHIALKIRQDDLRKVLPNLIVMQDSYQSRGLHTLFRDVNASRDDFVFYADRLMRLLVEEGLGLLPFERKHVVTPSGASYYGVGFSAKVAAVSLMPAGEAMENSLRAVCLNIRVGKMLIVAPSRESREVAYSKLPADLAQERRHILVLEPVLNTGLGCITAIEHLLGDKVGCSEERIVILSVIASSAAAREVCSRFPKAKLVVSAIDGDVDSKGVVVPGAGDFGMRYFGTD